MYLIHYYVLDLSFRESSSLFFVGDQLSPKILPATSGFSRHVSLSTKDDEQLKWFQIVQSLPFMSAKRSVFDTGHARWRAALKLQAASTMWILFLVLFKPFHILLKISGVFYCERSELRLSDKLRMKENFKFSKENFASNSIPFFYDLE